MVYRQNTPQPSQQSDPFESPRRPKSSPLLIIFIIVGIIVLALIMRSILYSTLVNDDSDSGTGVGIRGLNIDIHAGIEEVSDCTGENCFEEKFIECRPATITLILTDSLIYFYEIIGPKKDSCEVKSKFIANPNPNFVNKEMICLYDNSKDFDTAIEDMSNCEGDLYNLMTGT